MNNVFGAFLVLLVGFFLTITSLFAMDPVLRVSVTVIVIIAVIVYQRTRAGKCEKCGSWCHIEKDVESTDWLSTKYLVFAVCKKCNHKKYLKRELIRHSMFT